MITAIREQLLGLAEEDYKKFSENLLPGVEGVLGIRMPVLRQIAKEITRGNWREYLDEAAQEITVDSLHEEIMLQGLVLGYAKMEREERVIYLDDFVPKIQNWAVCDSCTMGFKFMQKEPEFWHSYIIKYLESDEEFKLRFLLISLLAHFIDEKHIAEILDICNNIRNDGYYVKMGVAWLVSVCYVKFPEETERFLKMNHMDDFTHNKSIQKIRESYRVSREDKDRLTLLKRKVKPTDKE